MNKILTYSFICLGFIISANAKAEIIITEIMQSNVSGIMDELGDFPDSWVELHNTGDDSENLSNYHIGLKKKVDKAYQLPDIDVAPDEYVIIYCDKVETGLHTSFRLESNKSGEIYLFKNGIQIQLLEHPAFPAPDIAYGLDPETNEWGYELTSTPGKANIPGTCEATHILPSPVFNVGGGIMTEPTRLVLSVPEGVPADTEIRYTTDGSIPSITSYKLEDGDTLNITTSTVVRANLFCKGWLSPTPLTHSYIYPDHEISLPIISISSNDEYFFDSGIGIYPNNYKELRRPINIEYFNDSLSEAVINQLGECRLQGNASRSLPLKSLAIYANKRFGEKRFDYEFFPEMRPGITNYKSLILRNAGNDFFESYMRDAIVHENVGNNMEIDYQAVRSCVVFLNGIYQGIMNIRERSNEDNIYSNYDELEDIHMIENWEELKAGEWEAFQDLMSFYKTEGHTASEYKERIDVEEVMDVHLANLYYNNLDFPANNMVLWKPMAEGGKWREIMKDVDWAMGLKYGSAGSLPSNFEILTWLHDPSYPAGLGGNVATRTYLFRRLESIPEISEEYINRALVYMGDFLNSRETCRLIDRRYELLKDEWQYHYKLFEGIEGISAISLKENVDYIKNWITERDTFFPQHFADFYELGEMNQLEIIQPEGYVKVDFTVNDIPLKSGQFTGYYPSGRHIEVRADIPDEEAPIIGWTIKVITSSKKEKAGSPKEDEDYINDQEEDNFEKRLIYSDSLEFDFPVSASSVILQPILDTSQLKSDLRLKITDDNEKIVDGITVEIQNVDSNIIQSSISNHDGIAVFENLDWGRYLIYINDSDFLFHPFLSVEPVEHLRNEELIIALKEKVVNPTSLQHEIIYDSNSKENKPKIVLCWSMEGYEQCAEFYGYEFHIILDELCYGSTNSLNYTIENLESGLHSLYIYATTPSGMVTDSIGEQIEIEGPSSVTEMLSPDYYSDSIIYYDINGNKLANIQNLMPGIYIRKKQSGETEKFIIR